MLNFHLIIIWDKKLIVIKQIIALAIFMYALLNTNMPLGARLVLLLISYDALSFFTKIFLSVLAYYFGLVNLFPVFMLLLMLEIGTFIISLGIFKPLVKSLVVFLVAYFFGLSFSVALFAAFGSLILNSVLK